MPSPHLNHHIFTCTNQRPDGHRLGCCASKGSAEIRNHMKARAKELGIDDIRVSTSSCLNACAHGPAVVIYPEGIWYQIKTNEDAERVLTEHVIGGKVVEDLLIQESKND